MASREVYGHESGRTQPRYSTPILLVLLCSAHITAILNRALSSASIMRTPPSRLA